MSKVILCDIDGTVANNDHRQHLLKNFNNWNKFFLAMSKDDPYPKAVKLLENFSKDYEIIFLTGRPERYRKETTEWLKKNINLKTFELIMRENEDFTDKVQAKKKMFRNKLSSKKIKLIIENDEELINLWESLNLDVLDINKINNPEIKN